MLARFTEQKVQNAIHAGESEVAIHACESEVDSLPFSPCPTLLPNLDFRIAPSSKLLATNVEPHPKFWVAHEGELFLLRLLFSFPSLFR